MSLLILDDDQTNRDALAQYLTRDGYVNLTLAGEGAAALAAMRSGHFDLILLDIMMPMRDGFGVLEAIQADPRLKGIPVIVMAAHDHLTDVTRAMELGAADYLAKPLDAVLLRARVRACLERRQLQTGLEDALAETRAMLDINPVATMFVKRLKVVWMNPMCTQLHGYKASELAGHTTRHLHLTADDYKRITIKAENALKTGAVFRGDVHLRRKDGRVILVRLAAKALAPWDLRRGVVWVMEDVTEQRADAARIAFMAHHDQLTGLPNRLLLADRTKVALSQALRARLQCAVLFLDLDKFKIINDTLGHAIGDELLIEVARRLRVRVRDSDTVARIGGDEFVIVLPALKSPADAEKIAGEICAALTAPYALHGHEIHITPSIGLALYPQHGNDADALFKCADEAMYQVKQAGRNGYRLFAAPA